MSLSLPTHAFPGLVSTLGVIPPLLVTLVTLPFAPTPLTLTLWSTVLPGAPPMTSFWSWVGGSVGTSAQVPSPCRLDLHSTELSRSVMLKAGPWPVFRLFNQTSFDRIAMDVPQLFRKLFVGKNIEIIVATLP